ncbi:GDSL-type esterase/lipase family protein [Marinomonas sp. C2222]|uniref:GDSL-type esterase/lipase family protein n=1 Tax=Marinomonas sargassi TaxID=2984494 RepID=A0ABT2YPB0_9GAMM|nr:GDSL-type esterase/lipase family protein [Marinomonas sargassi]MCV2401726.1 GDSL-type esterase/lipase family protein [Marinomonas sargassi]
MKDSVLALLPIKQEADWWLPRHGAKLVEAQSMEEIDIVFLGDSIFQAWETAGAEAWQQHYGPRNALNLGFNGDRTEHVLWRIEHGALDNMQPKVLVLLIGTNNTGHRIDNAGDTALGIQTILERITKKLPHTKIILLAIFPRSAKPTQRLRMLNDEVNLLIQKHHDGERIFFLNINHIFLDGQGRLGSHVMKDYLHPNADQYERIAAMINRQMDLLNG